jgi:sodium-dependent dicarboxylate transporter 2/3/5
MTELNRRSRRWLLAVVVVGLSLLALLAPRPSDLSLEAQRSTAIFILCLGLWVTHLLPLHITSILAIVLVSQFGVVSTQEAYALFGNSAVFFILGSFILSGVMVDCGLSTRLTLLILRSAGRTAGRLRATIFLLAAFSSLWMSEHAVAAMMLPIVLEIVGAQEPSLRRGPYARSLVLALAWGCTVGGIGTYLGGARGPLAAGILQETEGITISFLGWMAAAMPVVVIGLLLGGVLLKLISREDAPSVAGAEEILAARVCEMGRIRRREVAVGAVMLCAILSWVFLRGIISLANTSLAAVVLLFALGLVKWRNLEHRINWGIILMYGGAICLGSVMDRTGAAHWLAERVLGSVVPSPLLLLAGIALLSLFLTEGVSNAAAVAILMPVALSAGKSAGVDLRAVTLAIAVPAGLAFMLPTSTPAMALAYSTAILRPSECVKVGLVFKVLAWVGVVAVMGLLWPVLGMRL